MTYVLIALAILAAYLLLRRNSSKPSHGWQFDKWTRGVKLRMVVDLDDEPVFDTLARLGLELVTNDAPR